jgi:hypothetical protein
VVGISFAGVPGWERTGRGQSACEWCRRCHRAAVWRATPCCEVTQAWHIQRRWTLHCVQGTHRKRSKRFEWFRSSELAVWRASRRPPSRFQGDPAGKPVLGQTSSQTQRPDARGNPSRMMCERDDESIALRSNLRTSLMCNGRHSVWHGQIDI